ncbi:sugar ABC transporter substrate-binding protein [Agromyces sp. SYSU T00194]|uniref:sugar ABC transporter substrate-binding protein n=1 Tax=Agromyces chitinivorans TaxID=3158560 RepID=UPI0033932B64
MKRSAIALVAGAGLVLSLAACSNGDSGDTGGDEQIELVVWESLEGRSDFIEQAGEAYTAEHPNVTIVYKNVELGDALGQIALDGPAGVGADVFAAPSNVTGDLVTGGHILPVADPEALEGALVPGAIAGVTYQEQIWGVPVTIDTYGLFYNKEYVTDVPTTWADVIGFSEEFNADNPGKYGFAFNPSIYYSAPWLFSAPDNLLFGPAGDDPETPNTNTPATVAGAEQLVELRSVLDVPAEDLDAASVDSLFEGGQSAMSITGSWNIPVFDAAGLDYGVATLPALEGSDTPAGSFSNSRTMFTSAYTDYPEAAQDFAAFLASPEMLKLAYDLTGSIPPAEIDGIDNEATLGLAAQGAYAFPTPSIPEMTLFWTAMDSAIINIWNGADIQTELDTATEVILNQ